MFSGFPEAGFVFLQSLLENNNREWFEAHKDEYVKYLKTPATEFIQALGEKLKTISPAIQYDLRGSLMRIHRDTRFSKDKTPYKIEVTTMFWQGDGKKTELPCFGFRIHALEGAGLLGGVYQFTKPMLEAYRIAVLDDKQGAALIRAAEAVPSEYSLNGQTFKRVPRGYDAEHPRAEWLKYSGLFAISPHIPLATVKTAELVDACFEHCRKMSPIQQWLALNLLPELSQ